MADPIKREKLSPSAISALLRRHGLHRADGPKRHYDGPFGFRVAEGYAGPGAVRITTRGRPTHDDEREILVRQIARILTEEGYTVRPDHRGLILRLVDQGKTGEECIAADLAEAEADARAETRKRRWSQLRAPARMARDAEQYLVQAIEAADGPFVREELTRACDAVRHAAQAAESWALAREAEESKNSGALQPAKTEEESRA